jgi:hypothetical protein
MHGIIFLLFLKWLIQLLAVLFFLHEAVEVTVFDNLARGYLSIFASLEMRRLIGAESC